MLDIESTDFCWLLAMSLINLNIFLTFYSRDELENIDYTLTGILERSFANFHAE